MPKVTSPKVKALMAKFTKQNADKAHRKAIVSLRYIRKYFPPPVMPGKNSCISTYKFPKVVGVTGGRTLTRFELEDITALALTSTQPANNDGVAIFARRIRKYLPDAILFSPEWFNNEKRIVDETVRQEVELTRIWFEDYMADLESIFTRFYLAIGERTGAQYLKVLERRFRKNWNVSSSNLSVKASMAETANEEEERIKNVTFNFEVVTGGDTPNRDAT